MLKVDWLLRIHQQVEDRVARIANFTMSAYSSGRRFRIPVAGGIGMQLRFASEPWMATLLTNLLPIKEGTFVDVGVNLGQTLVKVKCIEPGRHYVGIEPNPTCVAYVNRLIELNGFSNAELVPAALFNRDCLLSLIGRSDTDSAASVITEFRPDLAVRTRQWVPSFLFSTIASAVPIPKIGFVKVDVEGAELEAVEGLGDAIQTSRPIVLIEVLPVYSSENRFRMERQERLQDIFRSRDYAWFRVLKSRQGDYTGLSEIEEIEIHADLDKCDYVVVPCELKDHLLPQVSGHGGSTGF